MEKTYCFLLQRPKPMFYIGFLLVVVLTTEVLTMLRVTDTLPLLTFSLPLLHLRNNDCCIYATT